MRTPYNKPSHWLTLLLSTVVLCSCSSTPVTPPVSAHNNNSDNKNTRPGTPRCTESHSNIANAVPRAEPRSRYGNPPSYSVFGETYTVLDNADGFVQRGVSSWYGSDFHGKRTSSGEAYDMEIMTAAHKTLPLPTYVRVTNLDNGLSAIVRINDRGPFVKGRIIDLSFGAAKKLGVDRTGTANVEIRSLTPGDNNESTAQTDACHQLAAAGDGKSAGQSAGNSVDKSKPGNETTTPTVGAWYVQLGAFGRQEPAITLADKARPQLGYPVIVQSGRNPSGPIFRVRVGPLANREVAEKVQDFLEDKGYDQPALVAP